ncbi:MAG: translation initiation factor IF-2 subunit beta [Metallosphaera sp.]|uniref:Translation initiation factor 2 subunit beta n=1 Tax=Metallosphaera cuprina (strain Ar-4) TaxID=1006006 RepID=F4FYP0_METCR|nr:translation initiation factor IF-2 subunit beta [Metallosphaera cuprina]AEB95538.1 translation initiation factor IF-2 subunit beta [Metallosphaera cuprina Ar-4]
MNKDDKQYFALLDRLYIKLPKKDLASETQALPVLSIINIGNTTIIRNFGEFCDRIRREDKICMRYLLKELAAAGSLSENGQLSIQGKFSSSIVNTFMDRFIKTYVQCSTCKSLDTVLVKDKKIWYIQCLACGAKNSVKPL